MILLQRIAAICNNPLTLKLLWNLCQQASYFLSFQKTQERLLVLEMSAGAAEDNMDIYVEVKELYDLKASRKCHYRTFTNPAYTNSSVPLHISYICVSFSMQCCMRSVRRPCSWPPRLWTAPSLPSSSQDISLNWFKFCLTRSKFHCPHIFTWLCVRVCNVLICVVFLSPVPRGSVLSRMAM